MSAFDLRVYHVVEGQLETLQQVLRDVALPIMPDHGMHAVGFWTDTAGTTLYQVTRHEGPSAVDGNWERLHADPRWQAGLQAVRQDRSAVKEVVTTFLHGVEGLPPFGDRADT